MFAEVPSYSKLSWVFCTKQAYKSWLNFIDFLPCFMYITIPCPLKPLLWTFQTSTESHLPFLWTKIAHDIFLFTHEYSLKFLFLSQKKNQTTQSSVPQYLDHGPKGLWIYKWVRVVRADYLDHQTKATFEKLGHMKWGGSRDNSHF